MWHNAGQASQAAEKEEFKDGKIPHQIETRLKNAEKILAAHERAVHALEGQNEVTKAAVLRIQAHMAQREQNDLNELIVFGAMRAAKQHAQGGPIVRARSDQGEGKGKGKEEKEGSEGTEETNAKKRKGRSP